MISNEVVCSIQHLSIKFLTESGQTLRAVDDLSLEIRAGEVMGIVGESGSGKSMLALSILGLPPSNAVVSGSIFVKNDNILEATPDHLLELRGKVIGLILQDPVSSLNPVRKIEKQLFESGLRTGASRAAVSDEIDKVLSAVGLSPSSVRKKFPFQLSGGMNQRISIAMALLQRPAILIADEPTTALDVSTQYGILKHLYSLQRSREMSLVMISHDLGVVRNVAQRIAVMYAGKLVEVGPTEDVIAHSAHPYTQALVKAAPALDRPGERIATIPGQLTPLFDDDMGCPFRGRCPYVMERCSKEFPEGVKVREEHTAWCWLHTEHGL